MKRSKSSPGKGPGSRKGKSDKFSKPKRSYSKSSGGPDSRGKSKSYGSDRLGPARPDKKSVGDKPYGRGKPFNREEKSFDKGEFKRKSTSGGRSFSKPRSNGDRPVRFKPEGDFSEKKKFDRPAGGPPGKKFSSPFRGSTSTDRFKREGENSRRESTKRSFEKSVGGGTYLRRKEERPDRNMDEKKDTDRPNFRKPEGERNFQKPPTERTPFRDKRPDDKPEKFADKRKRKRIGDTDKPAFKRRDNDSAGRFDSKSPSGRSDSPRSFGEKRFEKKTGSDRKERRGFVKPESSDRPERPWNRKEKHEFYGDRKKKVPEFLKASEDGSVRLNKFIANAGICSRREADEMIEAGVISVNGEVITEMGYKVMPGDSVKYNNELLRGERLVYILLNKPKDFITTTDDPEDRKTVMNLIAKACKERVYPVGRLDRNTTGVLLFTNDGDLAKKLTHPSFEVHKVYQVELDRALKSSDMDLISDGVKLDDGFIKPDEVVYANATKNIIGMELHSGKNRIVRRIFEHIGYEVKKLDRVVFAGLTKKDVPRGRWRFLSEMEIANLKMITGKRKIV